MPTSVGFVRLAKLIYSFCVLLVLGLVLSVPLFKFKLGKFIRSSLFIKIMLWIPIFAVFLIVLYFNNLGRLVVLVVLLVKVLQEFAVVARNNKYKLFISTYGLLFSLGMMHFVLSEVYYAGHFVNLLITLGFASVLADVTAFFLGNYFGKHKLPDVLNHDKSWEGVAGQVIGALLGVIIVNSFVIGVATLWLFVPIGLGSAAGDLANSFVKRKVGIKDWGRALPGHGGFADRLSSLVGSAVFMFYFLKLSNII